jgi:hypothetical protein
MLPLYSSGQEFKMFVSICLSLADILTFAGGILWKINLIWCIPFACLFVLFLLGFSRLK